MTISPGLAKSSAERAADIWISKLQTNERARLMSRDKYHALIALCADPEFIIRVTQALHYDTAQRLGIPHRGWLMRQDDPIKVIGWKLAERGRTTTPAAYRDLVIAFLTTYQQMGGKLW